MTEHAFQLHHGNAACTVNGSGRPLLLIHGFPFDHTMWQNQIEPLAEHCQVIAPDLRGYGGSSLAQKDAEQGVLMSTYAEDLIAVLDQVGVNEPVILCGFSMGGYILWQLAKRFPERVKALVPCDTRAAADTDDARAGREKMASTVAETGTEPVVEAMLPKLVAKHTLDARPELVEQVSSMIRGARPAAIAAAQRGMAQRPDMTDALAEFDWPALLIGGAEDAISPPAEMRGIADVLPQGRFVEIAGAGHMSPLENAPAFNEALLAFVRSL